mmetsp:Transcript_41094/g.66167  ORF Transcript_41094/g.66167 Transcript_41094/m.66167 type:complete len:165 (+) Transcript_41094:2215-2709(+)
MFSLSEWASVTIVGESSALLPIGSIVGGGIGIFELGGGVKLIGDAGDPTEVGGFRGSLGDEGEPVKLGGFSGSLGDEGEPTKLGGFSGSLGDEGEPIKLGGFFGSLGDEGEPTKLKSFSGINGGAGGWPSELGGLGGVSSGDNSFVVTTVSTKKGPVDTVKCFA